MIFIRKTVNDKFAPNIGLYSTITISQFDISIFLESSNRFHRHLLSRLKLLMKPYCSSILLIFLEVMLF